MKKSTRPVLPVIMILLVLAGIFPGYLMAASATHLPVFFTRNPDKSMGITALEFSSQEIDFPIQTERNVEMDQTDERIQTETRSSVNTFSSMGIRAGFKPENLPFFYLAAGYAEAEVDFHLADTNTDRKNDYTISTTFSSDSFPVFGGGITLEPLRKPLDETHTIYLGLDLGYRYWNYESKKTAGSPDTQVYQMTYESTLHEVQLSLVGAVDGFFLEPKKGMKMGITPFAGCRIAHFFAKEKFSDTGNLAPGTVAQNDPIFYDGVLQVASHISFMAGAGIEITKKIVMTLEVSFGDENGYAGSIFYRF